MTPGNVTKPGIILALSSYFAILALRPSCFARPPAVAPGENDLERRLVVELKEAGRDGNWFKAQTLLSKYTGCTVAVVTAALAVAHRCGRYREGARIYEKFRAADPVRSTDAALQAEAIRIFAKLRAFGRVRQVWGEAREAGAVSAMILSARLEAAAAEGDVDAAEAALQEMCERGMAPGVEHFNSAILACENSDKFTPAAMFLFESMLTQGVMPNIATLTTLTACYAAAPLADVLAVGAKVQALGLKADSAFAEAYTCAILGLPRNKRMYGRTLTTFAKTLESLSSARKAAARRAISELRADGVRLPRFCQIVAAKLFFPGAMLKVATKTWPKAGG